jgi:hypothetical protein
VYELWVLNEGFQHFGDRSVAILRAELIVCSSETLVSTYHNPSRYKSEALRLWPQRCDTAKPTLLQQFQLIQSNRHTTVVVAVPSTVRNPTNYKIKQCSN